MSDLSARIEKLSPAKLELLAQRLRTELRPTASSPKAIPQRSNPHDPSPLSFAQQRLWFFDQLAPGNPFYNIAAGVRLTGELNRGALERSFDEIVRRHQTLRTVFEIIDSQPVQRVTPNRGIRLAQIDLADLSDVQREAEVQHLAVDEARRHFDLRSGPLLRVILLRLGEREHVVLLTMHHIISDGWSMNVLIRELVTLYESFAAGKPSPLPELPVQYADFAAWQREWLQGEVLETQLAYWKDELADTSGILALPTDHLRPAVQSFQGARQVLEFPRVLTQSLTQLSRREGVTLFVVLLAAFQTLLYHLTDQEDFLVGSPIAGRNRSELEKLVGFFANILALRADLSGDPSFRKLLARVHDTALAANDHHDVPFDKLVEELQPERDMSRTPLFQVAFTLQHAPEEMVKIPGLVLTILKVDSGTAQFDLVLNVVEKDQDLFGTLEYSKDLFNAGTAARLLKHLVMLLNRAVAQPETRMSEFKALLAKAEKQERTAKQTELEAVSMGKLRKSKRKSLSATLG